MWSSFVELIRVAIFATAHVCGGSLGAGIVFVSVAFRLALLPLTLRLARQAREQQAKMASANGVRPVSLGAFVGLLVQMPLLGGLFAAVRGGLGARVPFLWVTNLAKPDALLLAVVTLLGGAVVAIPRGPDAAPGPSAVTLLVVGVGGTLLFLWSASSAVALSVGAGSLVSCLQGWLLSRDRGDVARVERR
jgi:membrane protein insertase Oxa1/YidC/SpoIIIJ